MKKYFISILFFVLLFTYSDAQQTLDGYPQPRPKNCQPVNICPRNTLFLEENVRFKNLFGLSSINWDHTLICRENYLLSYTLGIDFWSFKKTRTVGVPATLNLMLGGGALMVEISGGLNYLYVYKNYNDSTDTYDDKQHYLGLLGRVGLRYEKQHSIFFRAGYTPMYSLMNYDKIPILSEKRYNSMFGLGVGYTF
ncbi:MAG TPA: hypothetical protein PKK00_13825 [Bacteroidales bacterium]|nr:hypothetical protein [Bacteroidales bacterium]HPS18280.1 hypothetical protein [Bacteroidales bacterium]